jgi:CBS domain-containing protein
MRLRTIWNTFRVVFQSYVDITEATDMRTSEVELSMATEVGDSNHAISVRQLLGDDRRPLLTVAPDSSAHAAIQLMAGERVSALPVVRDDTLVGIVSERDYLRKIASRGVSPWSVPVREIMTFPVITVTPAETLSDCLRLMGENRIRHLPVIDEGRLIAIMSMTDIVKFIGSTVSA